MLPGDVLWLAFGAVAGGLGGLVAAGPVGGAWYRRLAVVLACAHLGGVLGVTLLPLGAGTPYEGIDNITLQPLRTISMLVDGSQSARQLGGNLLLLAPMGLLVPVAWRAARPWRRTLGLGLLVSIMIELGQYVEYVLGVAYRVVDVDDVMLNVLGVAAGRAVFEFGRALGRALTRGRRRR